MRAREHIFGLIIISLFFFANISMAADVAKIGVVDMQKILETSSAGKAIQVELKKEKDNMEKDLQKKGSEIEQLRSKLERDAMVMNKDMREKKERETRIKINDFKTLQQRYRSELQALEVKLINKLKEDIYAEVDKIGKKEGYLLIMNKFGILYSPSSVDITDKVIQRLNREFAKKR